MKTYKELQKEKQILLISDSNLFDSDSGNGVFMGREREFVLLDGQNNLYSPIREECISYFKDNKISWWGGNSPCGHVLSSQISCLNHLFLIRNDKEAVLNIINGVRDCFVEVLPIAIDKEKSYISFEVVSNQDHLNEKMITRGANCTSIDALVYARHKNGKLILLPIEWKYTESYPTCDKSTEDRPGEPQGSNARGLERLKRYSKLIDESIQLRSLRSYKGSVYFQEPFYQLMRQTLWAEQMILNQATELIKGDDFLHIHIVPKKNKELLEREYRISSQCMEETWKSLLSDQSKYILLSPEDLLMPIYNKFPQLVHYLKRRYW